MKDEQTRPAVKPYAFHYDCIRRISAPEDIQNGRTVHCGQAPAQSFLELPDDQNVRHYLLEVEGKKRKKPTQVLQKIRETLDNTPHDFTILNGGITIVCQSLEVDDKNKVAHLTDASIVNGTQTRGELKAYLARMQEAAEEPFPVRVKFELIETDDADLIAEIAIARNFQNNVMALSIAGRRKVLMELQQRFQAGGGDKKLQQSETELSEDYVKTEKLLQVLAALLPAELWPREAERDNPNKVYTYSMKSRCLKDFHELYNVVKKDNGVDALAQDRYEFYLAMAAEAWQLYEKWKQHGGFEGTGLHAIKRDGRKIKDVPDGIVFPILAALSAFAVKRNGKWSIKPPSQFSDEVLIAPAVRAYQEIAKSNPQTMGKSKACYSALHQVTSIYRELLPPPR